MHKMLVRSTVWIVSLYAVAISGCCYSGRLTADQLAAAQNHARDLYAENQRLLAEQMQNQQMLMGLDAEKQALMQKAADVDSQLSTANSRIENLMAERNELTDRYAKKLNEDSALLAGGVPGTSLDADGFEYDPATGLNKFRSDVLFDLGSDILRPEAEPVLSEFASAVKSGSASGMRILIVGHTDDQRIARRETAMKHPTNWHLSTDRSAAVILALTRLGVPSERMASMGYSEFQPLEDSKAEVARQRNRRVEMYVVPNDPSVARWDPATSVK